MSRRLLIAFVAAGLAAAAPARAQKLVPAVTDLAAHDANRVFLRVSNRGGFGLSLSQPDLGNFPRGSDDRYLFGAGLWIGGIGDVNGDGIPDSLVTTGYDPDRIARVEFIEGVIDFGRDDARFRVLDSADPADAAFFPTDPVADQELFAVYSDRFSLLFGGSDVSIPLGVEVRHRSFAFDEPGLDGTIFFQWDLRNISGRIRDRGYPIEGLTTGVMLDPDIGEVADDAAAPLDVDGREVLVVWDFNFSAGGFDGVPGFMAVVPLEDPGAIVTTQLESGGQSEDFPGVQDVPRTDPAQYRTMVGAEPNAPTIRSPGFDLRALIAWGRPDLAEGAVSRAAAAIVFAEPGAPPPASLDPVDGLDADDPLLANLVDAVRAARQAYADRLAGLPALLDFPGAPEDPVEGEGNRVFQNYPNPFDDSTSIEYNVVEETRVRIDVLDLAGSMVRTLVDTDVRPGRHTISWDGRSASGIEVPAGVYVIRMTSDGRGETSVRALKRP